MANLPFNLKIPSITKQTVANIPLISSADVFVGATRVLDPNGLFSVENFGRIGDGKRFDQFGTIHIKVKVLHPQLYKVLGKLKTLYKGILTSKSYAIWDEEQKDFIPASEMEGETGARFFLKYLKYIKFEDRKSLARQRQVVLIRKYLDVALSEYVMVLPAGMRDIEIKEDGRVEEDEINGLYRRLIMISNTVPDNINPEAVLDSTRVALQNTFNEIYDLLFGILLQGKRSFYMQKFLSRRVANGTRNVLTAMNIDPKAFGDPTTPSVVETQVGLFQTARAVLPITIHQLLTYFSPRFNRANNTAALYDRKTLKRVTIDLDDKTLDTYTTTEGLDKFINRYKEPANRHNDVLIKKYAVGLIYVDEQDNFLLVDDIDTLPESLDKSFVRPISMTELLYLCNYRHWGDYGLYPTRYPITGEGSTFPSKPYVKTTTQSIVRYELDPLTGERIGDTHRAISFPLKTSMDFLDSMVVHTARLAGMGADFDGDLGSGDYAYSNESIQEIKDMTAKRRFYVSADNSLRTRLSVDPLIKFFTNFTGEYV